MNTKLILSLAALVGSTSAAVYGPHGAPMCRGCTITGTGGDRSLWGWENNTACEIDTVACGSSSSSSATATGPHGAPMCKGCTVTSTGGDRSLWGWENNAACEIDTGKCNNSSSNNTQNNTTQNNTTQNNTTQNNTTQNNTTQNNTTQNNNTQNNNTQNNTTQNNTNSNISHVIRNGKTTRYWDCCKPSCAWNNKAPVSKPVDSCDVHGNSIEIEWTASGCDGGSAFICNDQQPWAVNDRLAYGFAAANIEGIKERDWCCGCYKLTFTNTSIAGKQMIVQVTNTGGDLGGNHFDLQIPGGGFGLFDGCAAQFKTDTSKWGDRYGGVRSISQCSALPKQLQDGCRFRFEWFENADNPNMIFEEVECPAEIVAITGCVRY